MPRTAFVTGATGFIGSHLIDSLFRDGWNIIAFVRATSRIEELQARGVSIVIGSLYEVDSIVNAMPRRVDAVFHVAANLSLWQPHHELQWKDNVVGTKAMVEAAIRQQAVKFIYLSSIASYGYDVEYINEETPQKGCDSPVNYARSKYAAEEYVRAAVASGLHTVILNPGHVVGPYDKHAWSRMLIMIASDSLQGIPPGSGSFCYAPNVSDAMLSAVEHGRCGENYLLGGGDASFNDFVQIASRLLGKKETRRPLPAFAIHWIGWLNDLYSYYVSGREPELTYEGALKVSVNVKIKSNKAIDELQFKTMALEESLRLTIDWLGANHYL